jgi:hypothetical protein
VSSRSYHHRVEGWQGRGKRTGFFMADPSSSRNKLSLPLCAKLRSGSRYTDFVPKPAENPAFPHERPGLKRNSPGHWLR